MSKFEPSKRQSAILEMVAEAGFVATEAMVTTFNVTPQTIRRDLNELSRHSFLSRFHGGAGQIKSAENPPYKDRLQSGVEAKRKIAAATAALIPNGASIFLSTGTTIEAIAEALLGHDKLHVFTNNLHVARILTKNESFQIIVSCGQVRHSDGGIIGSSSDDFIGDFRMDIGIVGISGVDEDGSLLEYDPQEVKTAKTILRNSQKVFMVADRHKFGRRAMNRIGHIRELDVIITDSKLNPHFKSVCEVENVEVIVPVEVA
ncbi:DeoR/GlpR family transcriptional regulator [Litorimonas cladophorae]|uniref:DeoR/GlpR family transcriptional regulator n=1 Tax=Litorimonas cladophorae TaxID=1220491 RepID=A0A918KRW1_9PROT|nr:DeoR family transcriptional regulator [Litorimonas cladophorae]GGX70862.1 DeoR/GlpR family transcriptional regulator [Litorimonas cladophorae]